MRHFSENKINENIEINVCEQSQIWVTVYWSTHQMLCLIGL